MALCIVLFCTEYRSGLKHAVKYADHHLLVELRALCEHCRTVEIIKLKYVIAIPDTAGVEQIAGKLRLRTVTVAPENYGKSLGSLAGYAAGTVPVSAETTLPETGLLVMCGLKNSRMDKLLAALRTAGIRIPHKAVLTPTNQNWNVYQLAQELERERQAMEKR